MDPGAPTRLALVGTAGRRGPWARQTHTPMDPPDVPLPMPSARASECACAIPTAHARAAGCPCANVASVIGGWPAHHDPQGGHPPSPPAHWDPGQTPTCALPGEARFGNQKQKGKAMASLLRSAQAASSYVSLLVVMSSYPHSCGYAPLQVCHISTLAPVLVHIVCQTWAVHIAC